MIDVKSFPVGYMGTNAYVITDKDTGDVALVDPGSTDSALSEYIDSVSDNIKYILLTHGHFDHIGGAGEYADKHDAKIVISSLEEDFLTDNNLNLSCMFFRPLDPIKADITLNDGDILTLGNTAFKFIHTPGHTKGSGCFVFEADRAIFSGDTLFFSSMGRTDFPTGDPLTMLTSLRRLRDLEGDYKVYPGHDRTTTLSRERDSNPYLR